MQKWEAAHFPNTCVGPCGVPTWGREEPSRAPPMTLPEEDAGEEEAEDNEDGETEGEASCGGDTVLLWLTGIKPTKERTHALLQSGYYLISS